MNLTRRASDPFLPCYVPLLESPAAKPESEAPEK